LTQLKSTDESSKNKKPATRIINTGFHFKFFSKDMRRVRSTVESRKNSIFVDACNNFPSIAIDLVTPF